MKTVWTGRGGGLNGSGVAFAILADHENRVIDMILEDRNMKTTIICGFPGIGKTTYCMNCRIGDFKDSMVVIKDYDKINALPSEQPKKESESCSNRLPCGWCALFDAPCKW